MVNEQIKTARALIRARRYNEARALLNSLEHPAAVRLNVTLDGFAEQPRNSPDVRNHSYPGWLPHALVDPKSPIFKYEARSLKRGQTPGDLLWITRQRIMWIVASVGLLWLVCLLGMRSGGDPETVYVTVWQGWFFAVGLSLLDRFVLDFTAVLAGLDRINEDTTSGRWDLIMLSNISIKQLMYAKFAVAQIRVWRTAVLVVGARLGIVLFASLQLFVLPLFLPQETNILNLYRGLEGSDYGPDLLILVFFMLAAMVLMSGVYIVEPLWRLRVLAAASLAVSSQRLSPTFALLGALGAVLGVWITQIMLALAASFITSFLWFSFFSGITAGFCVNLYVLGVGSMIYNTYKSMTTRWLNRAYRRLATYSGVQ